VRNVRARRRSFLELQRITLGDWIVLLAGALTVASLFFPWFVSSVASSTQWAFTYSEVFSVVVIVFFLATLFLVIYPALSPDLGLPPLPFSTPVIFLTMGSILLLSYMYQLGKYACIACSGTSRGFGLWLGLIASFVFIVGSAIKWGSRPSRRVEA